MILVSLMKLPDDVGQKLNILAAYPYLKGGFLSLLGANQSRLRLLVDSGAFTAYRGGKEIKLDDYCRFLETLPVCPWGYFMLDVIGEAEATLANYREMRRRGFEPIPIFTRGMALPILEEYFETSDVVGIGGLVHTPKNFAFINGIMEKVGERRVHLLGVSKMPIIKFYKPFSCDSSGWDQSRYGYFRLYMGYGQFVYIPREKCRAPLPTNIQQRLWSYGIDPIALSKESGWRGETSAQQLATYSGMLHFSLDIEVAIGTRYFLACAQSDAVGFLAAMERRPQ